MTDEIWATVERHLDDGNFTALQSDLGGPQGFDREIRDAFNSGRFDSEPEILAEALTCAWMLGRAEVVRFLVGKGVDPYAGMRTGLAGPHYAVSGGDLKMVDLLFELNVPLGVPNSYGGSLLGQTLWSAIHEHKPSHATIVANLIDAGVEVEHGTAEWWNDQTVPDAETKRLIAHVLKQKETSN